MGDPSGVVYGSKNTESSEGSYRGPEEGRTPAEQPRHTFYRRSHLVTQFGSLGSSQPHCSLSGMLSNLLSK